LTGATKRDGEQHKLIDPEMFEAETHPKVEARLTLGFKRVLVGRTKMIADERAS